MENGFEALQVLLLGREAEVFRKLVADVQTGLVSVTLVLNLAVEENSGVGFADTNRPDGKLHRKKTA